jgi:hypothetical protein
MKVHGRCDVSQGIVISSLIGAGQGRAGQGRTRRGEEGRKYRREGMQHGAAETTGCIWQVLLRARERLSIMFRTSSRQADQRAVDPGHHGVPPKIVLAVWDLGPTHLRCQPLARLPSACVVSRVGKYTDFGFRQNVYTLI